MTNKLKSIIISAKKAQAKIKQRVNKAEEIRNNSDILLNFNKPIKDYDIDFISALHTTLGGKKRELTREDLKLFESHAKKLGKRFKGGITAQQVIDWSLDSRREHAKDEIYMSAPTVNLAGKITFITNASKKSKHWRHQEKDKIMSKDLIIKAVNKVKRKIVINHEYTYNCTLFRKVVNRNEPQDL